MGDIESATLAECGVIDHSECEHCDELYTFVMRKGDVEFTMGLSTALACLAFAEQRGCVPKLPDDWWLRVSNVYS